MLDCDRRSSGRGRDGIGSVCEHSARRKGCHKRSAPDVETEMSLMLVVSFLVTDVRLVILMDGYRSAFSHCQGTYIARVLNQQRSTLMLKARLCGPECYGSLGALPLISPERNTLGARRLPALRGMCLHSSDKRPLGLCPHATLEEKNTLPNPGL
jgi:hypothetical protein